MCVCVRVNVRACVCTYGKASSRRWERQRKHPDTPMHYCCCCWLTLLYERQSEHTHTNWLTLYIAHTQDTHTYSQEQPAVRFLHTWQAFTQSYRFLSLSLCLSPSLSVSLILSHKHNSAEMLPVDWLIHWNRKISKKVYRGTTRTCYHPPSQRSADV